MMHPSKMNPMTWNLVIRGLEAKIEQITECGAREMARARASGLPYDVAGRARSRCNLKRMLRRRVASMRALSEANS